MTDRDPADGMPNKAAKLRALHRALTETLELHAPSERTDLFTSPANDLIADVLMVCAEHDEFRATRKYGEIL